MELTVEATVSAITNPARLWSPDEIGARPCPVPQAAGIYGWYFRQVPAGVPVARCARYDGRTLLYVGVSPAFVGSNATLRKRIRTHLRARRRSTLRRDLGCLLEAELDLHLALQSDGISFHYGESEEILSAWMYRNASVVWVEHPEPWRIEGEVIESLDLPLNINHNRSHPFCATLQALRDSARERAKLARRRA